MLNINPGYIINKAIKYANRPALKSCKVDNTAKIGPGCNCIDVKIGKYTYMGKNNSIRNANIGNYCSIASNCAIGGGSHPTNFVSTSPIFYTNNNIFHTKISKIKYTEPQAINIGNDVWIGENVFIKDGLNIGDGAIIGAHSVVTHDVPAYAIAAGCPAKIIRYRFSPEEIKKMQSIKWWEKDIKQLTKYAEYFDDVSTFIKEIEK